MDTILLSLSTKKKKKKVIYRFYTLLFVNIFKINKSQKSKWSPEQLFFIFNILKIVLKSGSQTRKI